MSLKNFAKRGALCAALFMVLSAGNCDGQGVSVKYAVERVPDEYRRCFSEAGVRLSDYVTDGKLLWKDAQRYIVALKAENSSLRRCGTAAIAWVDAQHKALNAYLGR